jgi:hypothetical protein
LEFNLPIFCLSLKGRIRRNLAIGGHIGLWRRCNIRDAGIQPNPARRTELVLTRPWSRLMSIAQT